MYDDLKQLRHRSLICRYEIGRYQSVGDMVLQSGSTIKAALATLSQPDTHDLTEKKV